MTAVIETVGDYTAKIYLLADLIPEAERAGMLAGFDDIADTLWTALPVKYSQWGLGLFEPDTAVTRIQLRGEDVGFALHYRVTVDGAPIIFFHTFQIKPDHQNSGLGRKLKRRLLELEVRRSPSTEIYMCWRTRNPIMWHVNADLCEDVVPDLIGGRPDPDLKRLAAAAAARVYPGKLLDLDTMAMREAFPAGAEVLELPHVKDATIDKAFYDHPALRDPRDAVFSLGRLKDIFR